MTSSDTSVLNCTSAPFGGTDGAKDQHSLIRRRSPCAIFIHAGAGFHSLQNERVHLEACSDAAAMGMKFLRAGAPATDAVEAAVRILEDKEITNAGFGSNLSVDGIVECDATIVDHHGRSGACGAVANVQNPICLAKLILDRSNVPLSLRRVPPNILVGDGARAFAQENGVPTVANEHLISKNARDRYNRWQDELRRAEEKPNSQKMTAAEVHGYPKAPWSDFDTSVAGESEVQYLGDPRQRDHANAIMTGTWNEGQPDSPPATASQGDSPVQGYFGKFASMICPSGSATTTSPVVGRDSTVRGKSTIVTPRKGGIPVMPSLSSAFRQSGLRQEMRTADLREREEEVTATKSSQSNRDGSASPSLEAADIDSGPSTNSYGIKRPFDLLGNLDEDMIIDTVGAIAIDNKGHIAAGSSSGGIGMKHRGRLGPAALVGIGTAVVPAYDALFDGSDSRHGDGSSKAPGGAGISVATVSSGTGEHMATTMASQRCAERIYGGTRAGLDGTDVDEPDEDAVMASFISQDFMNHPGVRSCHSVGAIGVMTVKQTPDGHYLYWAHNTDSFALASMSSSDREPQCVMSRLGKSRVGIARGGRKIRTD